MHAVDACVTSLTLLVELNCRFWRGYCFAHEKQRDNAEGNNPIHKHGEKSRPLENTSGHLRNAEDIEKRSRKDVCSVVNEAREAGCGICAEQFQGEAKGEQDFYNPKQEPYDLCATIERFCGG